MFNFFRKKAKKTGEEITKQPVQLQVIDYPAKVVLAWAKAVEGNEKLLLWLKDNGYPELFMATKAIQLNKEARNWLMNQGYAHLMAFIHASEGSVQAQKWLVDHQFFLLFHMAMAIESEEASWNWLMQNSDQELFMLTKSIKYVKDQIEENHNDIHSFRKDL